MNRIHSAFRVLTDCVVGADPLVRGIPEEEDDEEEQGGDENEEGEEDEGKGYSE